MTNETEEFMLDLAAKYFAAGRPNHTRWGTNRRSVRPGVASEVLALGLMDSHLKVALSLTNAGLLWVLAHPPAVQPAV